MILQHKFRHSASWQARLLVLALVICVLPIAVKAMSQDKAIERSGQNAVRPTKQAVRKAEESPAAAVDKPAPQPIDATTMALYRQYIIVKGKLTQTSAQAAIELVALRGHRDANFRALLMKDFVRSRNDDKFVTLSRKRNLLELVGKVLMHDGWQRWYGEDEKRTGFVGPYGGPTSDVYLYRKSPLLAQVIEYGRKCGASDIDAFVLVVRQAHHPQAKQFLLDVLHNDPPRLDPANPFDSDLLGRAADGKVEFKPLGKWADPRGGSWNDARFHAAIGLVELGVKDGVRWLIKHARPDGPDGTVDRHHHPEARNGSLRLNCELILEHLATPRSTSEVMRPTVRPRDWAKWWRANEAKKLTSRRVFLTE